MIVQSRTIGVGGRSAQNLTNIPARRDSRHSCDYVCLNPLDHRLLLIHLYPATRGRLDAGSQPLNRLGVIKQRPLDHQIGEPRSTVLELELGLMNFLLCMALCLLGSQPLLSRVLAASEKRVILGARRGFDLRTCGRFIALR